MKKNIKFMIGIVVGVVIGAASGVYATLTYNAGDIAYTKNGTSTPITVSSALNELYQNKKETTNDTKNITANGSISLDKYYKNLNVNVPSSVIKQLLWTNSNTSSSMGIGTISLSSSLQNYSHILIQWYVSTTDKTMIEDICRLGDYRDVLNSSSNAYFSLVSKGNSTGTNYCRLLYIKDSNTLSYANNMSVNRKNEGDDSYCIPYKIYGLNLSY